jgi:lysophospholipid acyltransferase
MRLTPRQRGRIKIYEDVVPQPSSSVIPHPLSSRLHKGRHLYSIATGALLLAYPFGPAALLHLAAPAAAVYAVMRQIRPHAGTLAWTLAFSYLVWRHVAGASGVAWKAGLVDYTGALMVLTLKVIAGAVAYQDGLRLAAEEADGEEAGGEGPAVGAAAAAAAPTTTPAPTPSPRRLLPYARAHALADLPTPLEWAGYCLGAGNLLSGPFFEVADYLAYTRREGDWAAGIPAGAGPAAAARLAKAITCGVAHSVLKPRFGVHALEGAPYAGAGLAGRLALLWASGVTDRLKYYFAWAIAEASLIASGFAYEGPGPAPSSLAASQAGRDSDGSAVGGASGRSEGGGGGDGGRAAAPATTTTTGPHPPGGARWERHTNAAFLSVELATSAAALPAFWNARTGAFLRHYVYERLTRGRRGGLRTMLATQAVAGVWHGLFPGYAMFFASSAFMFEAAKALYRYERHAWPRWVCRARLYRLVKWGFTAACLNYSASAFQILDAGPAWRVWEGVHFLPSFLMLAIVVVAKVVPPRARRGARRAGVGGGEKEG